MKIKLTIPDYLKVGHYQQLTNMEHLGNVGKAIKLISVISDIPEDEVMKWDVKSINRVQGDLTTLLNIKEEFYPIFEHDGVMYGFSNIHRMSLGEYNDLERLAKEPLKNLHEIMAILYRPITEHKLDTSTWKVKHMLKLAVKKVDNIFKRYEVEKYDSNKRVINADIMKDLPVAFALGAMGFFLETASLSSITTLHSLPKEKKQEMTKIKNASLLRLNHIGDGLRQFITSPTQVYSILQEKTVSLT